MNLPKKLAMPDPNKTKHRELYKTVNAIIDYVAEREPLKVNPEMFKDLRWEVKVEPQKPKKRSIWNLEDGDEYSVLLSDGSIREQTFYDVSIDLDWRENGSMFLTHEEAEAERERRREMAKGL